MLYLWSVSKRLHYLSRFKQLFKKCIQELKMCASKSSFIIGLTNFFFRRMILCYISFYLFMLCNRVPPVMSNPVCCVEEQNWRQCTACLQGYYCHWEISDFTFSFCWMAVTRLLADRPCEIYEDYVLLQWLNHNEPLLVPLLQMQIIRYSKASKTEESLWWSFFGKWATAISGPNTHCHKFSWSNCVVVIMLKQDWVIKLSHVPWSDIGVDVMGVLLTLTHGIGVGDISYLLTCWIAIVF